MTKPFFCRFKRVAEDVKNLAGDGQTDIGLDYSWLGDVTYEDWQRYHDLMRGWVPFFPFIVFLY